ncbi:MAG: hypothetical protein ACLGIG_03710 [Actinomycetes bacterium]
MPQEPRRRRPRRAVGPPGAAQGEPADLGLEPEPSPPPDDDVERYRREQPPHHDRGG